jgi:hypothetical protein
VLSLVVSTGTDYAPGDYPKPIQALTSSALVLEKMERKAQAEPLVTRGMVYHTKSMDYRPHIKLASTKNSLYFMNVNRRFHEYSPKESPEDNTFVDVTTTRRRHRQEYP